MYFEDLSPYRYSTPYGQDRIIPLPEVLHVGWLELGHDYTTGEVDAQTLSRLRYLITSAPNIRRHSSGIHYCDFCPPRHDNVQASFVYEGETIYLGGAQLWIPSPTAPGLFYAIPDLIYHYIVDHHYRPPDEFLYTVNHATIDPEWDFSAHFLMLLERQRDIIRKAEKSSAEDV